MASPLDPGNALKQDIASANTNNTITTSVVDEGFHTLILGSNLKFANDSSGSKVLYDKKQMGALSYEVTDNDGIQDIKTGTISAETTRLAINSPNTNGNGDADKNLGGGQPDGKGKITIKVKLEGGTKYKPTTFKYTVTYQ